MAEITVHTSHVVDFFQRTTLPKGNLKAGRQVTDFFFFFMTLTFWKTSPANRLVLSCLMWLEFLLGHMTPTHFFDAHFKNTNKPVWFFSFILFQINLGSYGVDQKGRAGDTYLCADVRPIIWGALGNKRRKKGNWTTQISDVCILTLKHLSGFLMPSRMSGLVQNEGGCPFLIII